MGFVNVGADCRKRVAQKRLLSAMRLFCVPVQRPKPRPRRRPRPRPKSRLRPRCEMQRNWQKSAMQKSGRKVAEKCNVDCEKHKNCREVAEMWQRNAMQIFS